MWLVVLVRVAISIQPASHSQPAHLDAVGLDHQRLPRLRSGVARPHKLQPDLPQVITGFSESGPSLVHHMVVGKRHDLDPVGLQRLWQRHRRVKHERL